MKTLKSFLSETNAPESLVRAVIKQIGGWQEFKGRAQDVANHGAAGGFGGFTYYSDTIPFAEKNKEAIVDLLKSQSEDFGSANIFAMIASFNGWDLSAEEAAEALYNPDSENKEELYNLLSWYALEEVARNYTDFCDQ